MFDHWMTRLKSIIITEKKCEHLCDTDVRTLYFLEDAANTIAEMSELII